MGWPGLIYNFRKGNKPVSLAFNPDVTIGWAWDNFLCLLAR
jgi:hypothetical protein